MQNHLLKKVVFNIFLLETLDYVSLSNPQTEFRDIVRDIHFATCFVILFVTVSSNHCFQRNINFILSASLKCFVGSGQRNSVDCPS